MTANYIQNRLPYKTNKVTPYEIWNVRKSNLEHIHTFGEDAYVWTPDEKKRKWDEELNFVGYGEQSKAFRLLNKNKLN